VNEASALSVAWSLSRGSMRDETERDVLVVGRLAWKRIREARARNVLRACFALLFREHGHF
jgi:hypothetical protein